MGLILVVSKDVAEIETIKAALSVHGWWVTVAPDRQGAIQAAADQAPKLVIIDHAVDGVLELVRDFGSSNGGPGAIVAVLPDFEGSLEMSEAGVDELLTKPISPPTVLESVQRCLAAPRNLVSGRAAPLRQLFTTEEIFGDVLREVETSGSPPPAPAGDSRSSVGPSVGTVSTHPPSTPTPAPKPPKPKVFDPTPPTHPVVSLAGLFDDDDFDLPAPVIGGDALAAQITKQTGSAKQAQVEALWAPNEQAGTPSVNPAEASDWDGGERRALDRPWSGGDRPLLQETPPPPDLPPLIDPDTFQEASIAAAIEVEEPATVEARIPQPLVAGRAEAEDPADFPDALPSMDAPPSVEELSSDDVERAGVVEDVEAAERVERVERVENAEIVEDAEAVAGSPAGRIPRKALIVGAIAATVLVAAGVVFMMNPGADVESANPVRTGEPVEREDSAADPSAIEVEDLEAPAGEPSAAADGTSIPIPAQPPVPTPTKVTPPAPAPAVDESIRLKAIVDRELERREEELRQVFLEEERKLLRELSDLQAEEAEPVVEGQDPGLTEGVPEAGEDGDGGF